MKRITATVLYICIIILICALGVQSSDAQQSVVVFGFRSNLMKDVDKRLLRDTISRNLHNNSYAIIPIMQLEARLEGYTERQRNSFSLNQIKLLTKELKAAYAITGSITPNYHARENRGIIPGKEYICTLHFYSNAGNSFTKKTFLVKGRKDYYTFFTQISDSILLNFKKYLTEK